MKSSLRLVRVALALMGVIVLGSEPGAKARSERSAKELQGTWRVTIAPYNCSSKVPLGVPFHALLAFARGGTLSGASSNSAFQPGQYSASFGIWRQTGHRTYSAVTNAFILFGGGPFPAGTQEMPPRGKLRSHAKHTGSRSLRVPSARENSRLAGRRRAALRSTRLGWINFDEPIVHANLLPWIRAQSNEFRRRPCNSPPSIAAKRFAPSTD